MPLVTESFLRQEATNFKIADTVRIQKSADQLLKEFASTTATSFDVFISHSVKDEQIVLGLYARLRRMGFSVYVDWIVDKNLDRTKVTSDTAEKLRTRMRQSKVLLYAYSTNATDSKWMPWELGYFDGFRSAVAVMPIARTGDEKFIGQEYLGLYPYVDGSGASMFINKASAPDRLFGRPHSIHPSLRFKNFEDWIREKKAA